MCEQVHYATSHLHFTVQKFCEMSQRWRRGKGSPQGPKVQPDLGWGKMVCLLRLEGCPRLATVGGGGHPS